MIDADFKFINEYLRLEGLLAGRFQPTWAGEIFWLLGSIYGAGS